MSEKLNILILHRMGDPLFWRKAVRDLEYMLPENAPEHNYIVHAAEMPIPEFIKEINFHGIVLGPTFLCNRYSPGIFAKTLDDYDFIRYSDAFKIAMPQDDYDCSGILDRWMVEWRVDIVYTVCPDKWSILYPEYSKIGKIILGYTGYITDEWIDAWINPKSFDEREVDVSYRASKLPPNFGYIGNIKSEIAGNFLKSVYGKELILDISIDQKDMIPGIKWHHFLENSKFCLVTNSGSSLLDRDGEIRKKVNRFLAIYPNADFNDVKQACFPEEDGKYIFTAISPRNIEAALAKTVQLATIGEYNGFMLPNEHYIPIEPDCSNIEEVLKAMKNKSNVISIAENCKETILSIDALRSHNQTIKMVNQIKDGVSFKNIKSCSSESFEKLQDKYFQENIFNIDKFWRKRRRLQSVKGFAAKLGAKRVRDLFFG